MGLDEIFVHRTHRSVFYEMAESMFRHVLVLGCGSAGLLAALSLKTKIPQIEVTVLRSPEIGVIGVGESTTPNMPHLLFEYLQLKRRRFYELAQPTWKLGIHFIWGPRGAFDYTFEQQLDSHSVGLERPNGYYCDEDMSAITLQNALFEVGKAFPRQANGSPAIHAQAPFHLENPKLVKALEVFSLERGVRILDGKMKEAVRGGEGIAGLILEDGRRLEADFYIDASGFRSELLGKAMEEPFMSFGESLFNDRAIVGNWDRTDENILPYTTAETMDAGWSWRIDHEHHINRGYVYCSGFMSDEEAQRELVRKNPKIKTWDRPIKFRSGRYQRAWVGNVMGIGNACGFVEPLESSALMVVGVQCENFVEMIRTVGITSAVRDLINADWAADWDEIRDFLTLHFWPNTRLDTPYWRHCNHDTDIARLKPLLDFYQDAGPTGHARRLLRAHGNLYGVEGFLLMLVGSKIPYRNRHVATTRELELVAQGRTRFRAAAQRGMGVK